MAINVSQAFHRTSANPVDESMALTKAQMLTVNDNLMPAYYFTICQDDGKIYLYDKSATASPTTGKFKEFEGGGGGGGTSGVIIDATLTAAGWNSSNQQTVTFTGYESSMGGVIGMPVAATAAQKEAYAEAKINVVSQSGTSFTFECEEIPSIDLPVTLYAGGGSGGGGGTASLFTITVTTNDGEHFTADKTPTEVETAFNNGEVVQVFFPMYGMTLHPAVVNVAGGMYVFSTMYTEGTASATAFCSILLAKDTATTWADVGYQTIGGDVFGEKIQYDSMPIASSSNVGQIVQYIGTTNSNYTNGLFYECINNNATYEWVQKDVQTYPEANLNNVFAGGMPSANMTGQQIHYSTNEQVIGTWIDGKPLYQKTINTGGLKSKQIATGITNIDYVVNIHGVAEQSGSIRFTGLPRIQANGNCLYNIDVVPNDGSYYIEFTGSTDWSSTYPVSYVTIQYTKTTD